MREVVPSYAERCLSPLFLREGREWLFPFFQYRFYGEVREGCLGNLSFMGEDLAGERGVIDGLLDLLEGRDERGVQDLTIRELDNFLRGENHVPVLSHLSSLDSWFELKECFLQVFKTWQESGEGRGFSCLSLLGRIHHVNEMLERRVRPFLRQGVLELLDVGDDKVMVSYSGSSFLLIEEFIKESLEKEFQESKISVMLVE